MIYDPMISVEQKQPDNAYYQISFHSEKDPRGALKDLLKEFPQYDEAGNVLWIVADGLAVEAWTDERPHKDADIIMFKQSIEGTAIVYQMGHQIDLYTPEQYMSIGIRYPDGFLESHIVATVNQKMNEDGPILTLHPAVLLFQKAFTRADCGEEYALDRYNHDFDRLINLYKTLDNSKQKEWRYIIEECFRYVDPKYWEKMRIDLSMHMNVAS